MTVKCAAMLRLNFAVEGSHAMLDDSLNDLRDQVSISRAGRQCGRHASTVWRWVHRGIRVGEKRVSLRSVRIGGRAVITASALRDFLLEINRSSSGTNSDRAAQQFVSLCDKQGL